MLLLEVWTLDGKHLVFSANRHDDAEYHPLNSEIYEVGVDGGTVRALTDRNGPDHSAVVSPDGKHIAYVGFDDRQQGYQVSHLYLMDRDGGHVRVVSGDLDRDGYWNHAGGHSDPFDLSRLRRRD